MCFSIPNQSSNYSAATFANECALDWLLANNFKNAVFMYDCRSVVQNLKEMKVNKSLRNQGISNIRKNLMKSTSLQRNVILIHHITLTVCCNDIINILKTIEIKINRETCGIVIHLILAIIAL